MAQLLKYMLVLLLAQIFVVCADDVNADSLSGVAEAFKKNELVPQVIPKAPQAAATVVYSSGEKANLGNTLTPTGTKCIPTISWKAEEGAYYTIILIDPDVPSREDQSRGPWIQWMVVNVPGADVSKGETVDQYISPSPPDQELRRYVILIYKQSSKQDFSAEPKLKNTSTEGRKQFQRANFEKKYNLALEFGNFFLAKYDSYVPHMLKQVAGQAEPDPCSLSNSSSNSTSC